MEFHFRDMIGCIRSLYSDPRFMHSLAFAPERHYISLERTCWVYNELYTCDWWWTVQVHSFYSDKDDIDLLCSPSLRIMNQGQP